jgi:hypothetical protein
MASFQIQQLIPAQKNRQLINRYYPHRQIQRDEIREKAKK